MFKTPEAPYVALFYAPGVLGVPIPRDKALEEEALNLPKV